MYSPDKTLLIFVFEVIHRRSPNAEAVARAYLNLYKNTMKNYIHNIHYILLCILIDSCLLSKIKKCRPEDNNSSNRNV